MDLGQFAAGPVALQGQLWAHGAGQDALFRSLIWEYRLPEEGHTGLPHGCEVSDGVSHHQLDLLKPRKASVRSHRAAVSLNRRCGYVTATSWLLLPQVTTSEQLKMVHALQTL